MPSLGRLRLKRLRDKRDVSGLINLLAHEKDPRVRGDAACALGLIGGPHAVELLIMLLEDSCTYSSAITALAAIGEPAVQPLLAVLNDPQSSVRELAAVALGRIGAHAVQPLLSSLDDRQSNARKYAASALGETGDAHAVHPLLAALGDQDPQVHMAAATALGRIGESAVDPLLVAVGDQDPQVRSAAAFALGRIGDVHAIHPLVAALGDDDPRVRNDAASALARMGAPAVQPLIDALDEPLAGEHAAEALGKIGDRRAIRPLVAALGGTDWQTRQAAAVALDQLEWRPGCGETGAAYWAAKGAWDQCVRIGAPAVQPVIQALKNWCTVPIDKTQWRKSEAAETLITST